MTPHMTPHMIDNSILTKQSHLLDFCIEARTRDGMQIFLDISNRSYFSKSYLKPLLESGRLKMTIPDKTKSKSQKYISVQKNRKKKKEDKPDPHQRTYLPWNIKP